MKLLQMDTKTLVSDFGKNYNVENFKFLIISNDISTNQELKNILDISDFNPLPSCIQYLSDGKMKKFKKAYKSQLEDPNLNYQMDIILKAAIKEDSDLVLLCSPRENTLGYMKVIMKYLKKKYKLEVSVYKKNMNIDKLTIGKKKKLALLKDIEKEITELKKSGLVKASKQNKDFQQMEMRSKLKDTKKKELKEMLKRTGVAKSKLKGLSKSELIEIILPSDNKKKKKDKKKKGMK